MFALFVFHRDKIGSPIGIGIFQVEGGRAIRASTDGEGFHWLVIRIGDIISQAAVVRAPPPVPMDFIDFHFEFSIGYRLSEIVDGSYFIFIFGSGLQRFPILLGRLDAGIATVG